MIEWSTELKVRYYETDKMGHVHHANYLKWFEVARIEMLGEWGLPYHEVEKEGVLLPVIEARVRYRKPAYFGDIIRIGITIKELPRVKLELDYRVLRDEALLAEGTVTLAFVNEAGSPIRAPERFIQVLKEKLKI